MKRFLTLIMGFIMAFSTLCFVGCKETPSEPVSIKYNEAPAVMQALVQDSLDFGLLPEPAATKLETIIGKDYSWNRMSLQDLYNSQTKNYPQAVLMVKTSILNSYPGLVNAVKSSFIENNVSWLKQNTNEAVKEISSKYASTSLIPANVITSTVIDNCNISWQDAMDAKASVKSYINDILDIDIGLGIAPAVAPQDDFFYQGSSETQVETTAGEPFTFYAPDGAPALAIARFINFNERFTSNSSFDYNVVDAETITTYMNGSNSNGITADFIVLPVNAATKLYNNANAQYKMVSVITHGNLYIMSKAENNYKNVKDLEGNKIGVIGSGKVPDLTLKSVLKKKGMTHKTVA